MRINSITNNVYGQYGPGPMPTIVEKCEVEPKHKKYYDRKPEIPYVEGETVVRAPEDQEATEDETVTDVEDQEGEESEDNNEE